MGRQFDTRTITEVADRDSGLAAPVVRPLQVSAYLSKYLTKTTEEFGLPTRAKSAATPGRLPRGSDCRRVVLRPCGRCLAPRGADHPGSAREGEAYERLWHNLATLGFEVVSGFAFAGTGYLDLDEAAAAVRSVAMARIP